MIDFILTIAKMLLAILPFILLCVSSRKVNITKPARSKQYFMPVIVLIYVIVAMLLVNSINEWLLQLIESIPKWIKSLAGVSWMPEVVGPVLSNISDFITKTLKNLNLNFWMFFVSNTVIILVYLLVKRICISIIAKTVKTDGNLHTTISGMFYEFFIEKNAWCIKESYVQVRSLFKVFYFGAVAISALLMLVSRWLYFNEIMKSIFYPVFGIIVVGELYFYLDGATKREYSNLILGEDEESYKTVNYSLLRKFLRSIFGDKLLSENTSINNALAYDVTTDEIVRKMGKSEDQKIATFASFIDTLNKSGFQIDHNYLYSSLEMLKGESVLFNNPFYNDLVPYAFYPMNRILLSHRKVLIVLGRHSIEDDIKEWIEKGIESVTNLPFMWNIGVLNRESQDLDIGIVTRSDVLDIELHNANSDFLENVGFCVVIEPSKLIATAQIGLNMLVKKCKVNDDKELVYCLCDKNCDGLVDAMSHILMTSITEVSATKKHTGTASYMLWESDEEYLHHRLLPNISRYLGLGTELSFAALKNQVSKTRWYGGETFPVVDMRWIAKQYYYELTKYANLPTNQDTMDEHFITSSNYWSAREEKNCYTTVEDESFNMFEVLRDFSTRTTEQGFINVISSDYLLRDYMADNASIFEADSKAIPQIVADYTRSNRNTALRVLLMLSTYPVSIATLEKELSLLGISVFDLKRQLWYELYNCFSKVTALEELPQDYKEAVYAAYKLPIILDGVEHTHTVIEESEHFDLRSGVMENSLYIKDKLFIKSCASQLKSAGYVAEDEKGERYYLGSELSGHIYQRYLPGQFFTFAGKYYEMQYLTADGHILVRRAADHINSRLSYRQIRNYTISGTKASDKIGAQQDVAGLKVIKEFADVSVDTSGYYRMERYNDFTTAKQILFEGNGVPKREYFNKEILRIELPDFGGKLSDDIRYTVTLLFNEIFRTIFAENQAYITAVTDYSFIKLDGKVNPLTYSLSGKNYELSKNAIYIIEDSQLDLGLTVAVERNLERILSIIHDYLDWHFVTLENSLNPPQEPVPPIIFTEKSPEGEEHDKKPGFFGRIKNAIKKFFGKIKGWFKKKPKKGETPTDVQPADVETPTAEETAEKPMKKGLFGWLRRKKRKKAEQPTDNKIPTEGEVSEDSETPTEDEAPANGETPVDEETPTEHEESTVEEAPVIDQTEVEIDTPDERDVDTDNTDGSVTDVPDTANCPGQGDIVYSTEDEQIEQRGFSVNRRPYHERYYLLYGQNTEIPSLNLKSTLEYLTQMGLNRNSLKQAREGKKIAKMIEATFKPGKPDARYCDFCGSEIYGVEYETLADGRDRCLSCSKTAIKTGEEFRKIFEDVKRNMESFFGIKINAGIRVEMVNAKKLHKRLGKAFIPTPAVDGRVLGVAIKDKHGNYTLLVENGSPRMPSMLTMAHELTHIWQYINWNDKEIIKKYGKRLRLEVYEGMANWVEIQYAYLINEPAVAKREEIITSYRDDEYGRGFLRYRANYQFSLGTVVTKATPFMNIDTPLDPEYCTSFVVKLPTDGINTGDLEHDDPSVEQGTPTQVTPEIPKPTQPIKGPKQRDPKNINKYAYNLLSSDEQLVYDMLLNAINDFAPEITGLGVEVLDTQMQKIVDYVKHDNPQIFWFRHGATYFYDADTHIVNKIELKYCFTKEETVFRQAEIEQAIKEFIPIKSATMSDYELVLRVYENIIKLVDYDSLGLQEQSDEQLATVPDDLRSIYGVFVNKKAVCAGYSKATQYLLNKFGIECLYVTSETHAWNVVKLEGDYYHLDTTWGDGSNTDTSQTQAELIKYHCFCITTEESLKLEEHIPEEIFPIPECTATKCNYYHRHGLYFEQFEYIKIKNLICNSVKEGVFDFSFKFASKTVLSQAKSQLVDQGKLREIIKYATLKTGVRIDTGFMYSVNDDRLIISFFLKKL